MPEVHGETKGKPLDDGDRFIRYTDGVPMPKKTQVIAEIMEHLSEETHTILLGNKLLNDFTSVRLKKDTSSNSMATLSETS